MRIIFISTVAGHGWPGSEYLWGAAAEHFLKAGHVVQARVSADVAAAPALLRLVERGLLVSEHSETNSRWKRLLIDIRKPSRALLGSTADMVVVSCGSAYDIAYRPELARALDNYTGKYIIVCHFNADAFPVSNDLREVTTSIYRRAAATVFVSPENHLLTERQIGLRLGNSVIIRPPLRCRLPEALPWPSESSNRTATFACVARLEPYWKGQDALMEVLSLSDWRERDWTLRLYGEGRDRSYLERLANHYAIADRVEFRGFKHDLVQIWSENEILVMPARGEGGPMAVTEAMMHGRPCVATRCGNVGHYVTDGETGFLADSAAVHSFGAAMERAWNARARWPKMGLAAHKWISELREPDPVQQLVELIETNW